MKKTVLKSIISTVIVLIILAVAAFGITSLVAPAAMMDFTARIGLKTMSGDYAFQEYERSGDINCLARSFLISAETKNYAKAEERFTLLYAEEGFDDYCKEQDEYIAGVDPHLSEASYRSYICGRAARVRYHLVSGDEEKAELIAFAVKETYKAFPTISASWALASEAVSEGDTALCRTLLEALKAAGFDETDTVYKDITKLLEEAI